MATVQTSSAVGNLLSHLASGVLTLLDSSAVQSSVKDAISGNIKGALNDLASEVPTLESDAEAAGVSMADAEITETTGPLSVFILPEANDLLNAVGGDLNAAISHLLAAKGIKSATIQATSPQ